MKKIQIFKIFILVNLFLITFSQDFELSKESKEKLNERLNQILENNQLIGLQSTYVKNGQILYESALGLQDQEENIKITENSFFRIASISKSVATSAFFVLVDQEKADIDTDISEYLGFQVQNPNFPNEIITMRQVLSHTSSINDGQQYDNFITDTYDGVDKSKPSKQVPTVEQILVKNKKYYTNDVYLNKKPGEYFQYCNLNFVILGTVIEKISNTRFDIFVKKNILEPLGIDTSFNTDDLTTAQMNNFAGIYKGVNKDGTFKEAKFNYHGIKPENQDFSQYVIGTNGGITGPQGGLKITTKNLNTFMQMLMNKGKNSEGKQIISEKSAELMLSKQWTYNGSNSEDIEPFREYGQGIHISTGRLKIDEIFRNKNVKGHSGDAYGLISNMYFDVDSKSGFTFATNGSKQNFEVSTKSRWYNIEQDIMDLSQDLLFTNTYINYDDEPQSYDWVWIVVGVVVLGIAGTIGTIYYVKTKIKKEEQDIRQSMISKDQEKQELTNYNSIQTDTKEEILQK